MQVVRKPGKLDSLKSAQKHCEIKIHELASLVQIISTFADDANINLSNSIYGMSFLPGAVLEKHHAISQKHSRDEQRFLQVSPSPRLAPDLYVLNKERVRTTNNTTLPSLAVLSCS